VVPLQTEAHAFLVIGQKGIDMLHSIKTLKGGSLSAKDGIIGEVIDVYFDDSLWTIRYLVVETGEWLASRKVLISPISINRGYSSIEKLISVNLTRDQVRNSPSYDSQKPVSRQYEEKYAKYYDWPHYWAYPGIWGYGIYPHELSQARKETVGEFVAEKQNQDPHLRSANTVAGYTIDTRDGRMGNVEDFLFEDETWTVRYLIIDTVNWWPSKKVLIAPVWASRIDWADRSLHLDLSKETIKSSPEYEPAKVLTRDYETSLYKHYGKSRYWDRIDAFKKTHKAA